MQLKIEYIIITYIFCHRSFTKSINSNGELMTPTTVGVIEDTLSILQPKNEINVKTISR